jgi:hypothetical protein
MLYLTTKTKHFYLFKRLSYFKDFPYPSLFGTGNENGGILFILFGMPD